jgi:type I restriction enzyme S subunit
VRVIRLENIGQLRFIEEKHCYISEAKYASLTRHTVSEHDIIFASFISDEVRACVLPRLATKAIAKADCFCLRPKDDRVDRRYLALQLVSHETHDAFIGDVHGATRPRINLTQLKQLKVRICPVEEQREIVRRVDVMFALVGRIEAQVRASTSRVNHLPQTILARAFRGELVPTEAELAAAEGRDYEPADRLLARIREATAQHDSQKKAAGATTRKRGAIKKMDKASAQQVIEAMPKGLFTFDELRAKLPGDYDALKEILFSLLDDPQSGVVQVFDKKAKSMRFQRMTKP